MLFFSIRGCLELTHTSLLLLLSEWRFLISRVRGVRITRVSRTTDRISLVTWRECCVRTLFKSLEREPSASGLVKKNEIPIFVLASWIGKALWRFLFCRSYPSEHWEKAECYGRLYVIDTISVFRILRLVPCISQIAKSYKVQECPEGRESVNGIQFINDRDVSGSKFTGYPVLLC